MVVWPFANQALFVRLLYTYMILLKEKLQTLRRLISTTELFIFRVNCNPMWGKKRFFFTHLDWAAVIYHVLSFMNCSGMWVLLNSYYKHVKCPLCRQHMRALLQKYAVSGFKRILQHLCVSDLLYIDCFMLSMIYTFAPKKWIATLQGLVGIDT